MRCPKRRTGLALSVWSLLASQAAAQSVLFDFNSTPYHTPLPIDLTEGEITASFSGTGLSYSIQLANISGITPAGFSGNCLYPNSTLPSDLIVGFSQALQDASIMYAPSERGCDSSATMRITGYMGGTAVATSTTTAPNPGTWPTGVLTLSSPQGFDSVVIHYDAFPNCENAAPIFVADNMMVTPAPALWIDNVAVAEGNAGTATLGFTVSLSPVSGQSVTVEWEVPPDGKRTLNGIVSRFSQGRRDAHFTHFRADLVPRPVGTFGVEDRVDLVGLGGGEGRLVALLADGSPSG